MRVRVWMFRLQKVWLVSVCQSDLRDKLNLLDGKIEKTQTVLFQMDDMQLLLKVRVTCWNNLRCSLAQRKTWCLYCPCISCLHVASLELCLGRSGHKDDGSRDFIPAGAGLAGPGRKGGPTSRGAGAGDGSEQTPRLDKEVDCQRYRLEKSQGADQRSAESVAEPVLSTGGPKIMPDKKIDFSIGDVLFGLVLRLPFKKIIYSFIFIRHPLLQSKYFLVLSGFVWLAQGCEVWAAPTSSQPGLSKSDRKTNICCWAEEESVRDVSTASRGQAGQIYTRWLCVNTIDKTQEDIFCKYSQATSADISNTDFRTGLRTSRKIPAALVVGRTILFDWRVSACEGHMPCVRVPWWRSQAETSRSNQVAHPTTVVAGVSQRSQYLIGLHAAWRLVSLCQKYPVCFYSNLVFES